MTTLTLTAAARLLVLAPHPDDESLASGGLIQQALAAGAAVQVVIATNGDNNPWPQRWVEKRWRIDAAARARWGARRQAEASAALRLLGLPDTAVAFLGWPDLGITAALLQRPQELLLPLRAVWRDFAPTHVVLPMARDTHPDHSAMHLLARATARSLASKAQGLAFAVHGGRAGGDVVLPLDAAQFERKRAAVLQHTSQLVLGQGRLLRFVLPEEAFTTVDFAATPHEASDRPAPQSLQATRRERVLLLGIDQDGGVHAAGDAGAVVADAPARLLDFHTGERVADVAAPPAAALTLPPTWQRVVELWVKHERRSKGFLVFDPRGWQPLPLS